MSGGAKPPPVWRASALAAAVAAVIVVVAILPAEYGFDPTGIGARLGLTRLAEPPAPGALRGASEPYRSDRFEAVLAPYESLEYKYVLSEDEGMVFAWNANAPLNFDMHSEPAAGPEGFAESFKQGRAAAEQGGYTAPFAGRHGWYWENRTNGDVRLTLSAAGFFRQAVLYRDGGVEERPIALEEPPGAK